jgi:hypothetical protein
VILSHYTRKPFTLDRSRTYDQSVFGNGKPHGLWLSVDDEWAVWCRSEEWNVSGLRHRTFFGLTETANVLTLTTVDEIHDFTDEYRGHPEFAEYERLRDHWVNWPAVAAKHDGILIAPFWYAARFDVHSLWYGGWDVASACIWNLDAVEETRSDGSPLRPTKPPTTAEVAQMLRDGLTRDDIVELYGRKPATVAGWIRSARAAFADLPRTKMGVAARNERLRLEALREQV